MAATAGDRFWRVLKKARYRLIIWWVFGKHVSSELGRARADALGLCELGR